MSFKFLKNKYFLVFILITILVAGGIFYWWQQQKLTPPEEWDTAEVSQREDYAITQQEDGGLLVKNEKAGLSLELPEGWQFEEEYSQSSVSGGVSFASPDMTTGTIADVVVEGCRLKISVGEIKTDFETFKENIEERIEEQTSLNPAIVSEEINITEISNNQATKHLFKNENLEMSFVRVGIPTEQRLYELGVDAAIHQRNKCEKEFEKILDTISIQ